MLNIRESLEKLVSLVFSPKIIVTEGTKLLVGAAGTVGDVFSESISAATPWTFSNCVKKPGGSGKIIRASAILETTALTPRLVIFLHTKTPTCNLLDNVANTAPTYADMAIYLDKIDMPAMEDIGTGMSVAVSTPSTVDNLPLAFTCAPNETSLYGVVASRDNLTPTALDDLVIRLTIEQY